MPRRTPTAGWKSSSARWGSNHPVGTLDSWSGDAAVPRRRGRCGAGHGNGGMHRTAHRRRGRVLLGADDGDLPRVSNVTSIVSAIHTTTRPDLIRRFLLLKPGDNCNELRRSESERILRAQPFIAEAAVRMVKGPNNENILEVRTSDEVALVLGVAATTASPPVRFVRLGDANIDGEGIYLAGDWRDGKAFRDGYGGRFVDNQLLGKPYTLTADAHVTPLGSNWNIDAMHPFYTDIQRIAWRARAGANDDYSQFRERRYVDARTAGPSQLLRCRRYHPGWPAGTTESVRCVDLGRRRTPGDDSRFSSPTMDSRPTPSIELLNRYIEHRIARINALWGIRDLGFARVHGFDALTARRISRSAFSSARCSVAACRCSARATTTSSCRATCTSGRSAATTRCACRCRAKGVATTQRAMGRHAHERACHRVLQAQPAAHVDPRPSSSVADGGSVCRSI